jgi:2-polyprenyl-3-methyl-5-hydroxy-6-metoxy-1,4-benzoquinol methylase
MIVNKLNWISSPKASPDLLKRLDSELSGFYATFNQRRDYQDLNDDLHETAFHPNNTLADKLATHLIASGSQNILEVGCGSGKIYERLQKLAFTGRYTGIEMADYVIQKNKAAYPAATWKVGSVYDVGQEPDTYDCCFAFFVLEHLIYPHKGLAAMLKSVRPGGSLILVFPDVRSSGIVASQKIGRHYGLGAKEKLKKGMIADAVISYWESRTMRKRLKKLNEHYGDFVINYTPYCLDKDCNQILPDFDAVYLASKEEVEKWATTQGCQVSYPSGTSDYLYRNAYMSILKS